MSRDELIGKPIALLHASHRGEDVLADLRRVLSTVSIRFTPDIFARFPLAKRTPEQVQAILDRPENEAVLRGFLEQFCAYISMPVPQ